MTSSLQPDPIQLARAESLFRSLWETTPDAVLMLDEDSIIRYANPGAIRLFGHPQATLEGGPLARVQPLSLRAAHVHGMGAYMRSGIKRLEWRGVEAMGLHADGREFPIEISFSEMELDGRRMFVGFLRDITERKRVVDALRVERARAQRTLRCIGDGVLTTDAAGCVVALNPMAERLTGWGEGEAFGLPCDRVLGLEDGDSGQPIPLLLAAAGGEGVDAMPLPANAVLHPRGGTALPIEGSVATLGADGDVSGWVIALRDVSVARGLATQLAHQATHDALTDLVNRGEFDRRLQALLASSPGHGSSLLYLDLDQFKIVNDTCGHQAGDELLTQLASILLPDVRRGDTLARLGGDEFALLIHDCTPAEALAIAERIRATIAAFVFVWKGQPFTSGTSIGHVHFDGGAHQAGEILSKADEACYVAKGLGRNRIHTYEPGEEAQALHHGEMQWVGLIHRAFDEQRFVLHAQPIFTAAHEQGPAMHHEVLVRMLGEDGALVPPMAFIPAAERYNLMPRIDRWVVETLLQTVAASFGDIAHCDASFAINLSGASLGDPDFAGFLLDALHASGIPGHCIAFEITETAAIANMASAVRLMEEVKRAGCRFALDDFGSGLSSFAYLKHLPVDALKIDGSFVRGVATDPVDRAMVASINQIGHLLGLWTVAECVENDDILRELRVIGVDYVQGYALGRPRPLEQCLGRAPVH